MLEWQGQAAQAWARRGAGRAALRRHASVDGAGLRGSFSGVVDVVLFGKGRSVICKMAA